MGKEGVAAPAHCWSLARTREHMGGEKAQLFTPSQRRKKIKPANFTLSFTSLPEFAFSDLLRGLLSMPLLAGASSRLI